MYQKLSHMLYWLYYSKEGSSGVWKNSNFQHIIILRMVFLFLPSAFNRTVIPIQELPVHSFYTYYSDNRWIQPLAGQCSFYFHASCQLFVHCTSTFWLDQKEIICILPLYLHDHAHGNAFNVSVCQHKEDYFSSEFRIYRYEFRYNSCGRIDFIYSYAYCRKYYV